jgi:DNA polymerase I
MEILDLSPRPKIKITPQVDLGRIRKAALESGLLCFDVEHESGMSWMKPGFILHGCGFASVEDGKIISEYVTDPEEIGKFVEIFNKVELVAHNAKFDLHCLRAAGYKFDDLTVRDTMIVYNLIDENLTEMQLGLKKLVKDKYGHQMVEYSDAAEYGLDSPEFREYGLEDVIWETRLYLDGKPKLDEIGCWNLFDKILTPAIYTFFDMEHRGLHWDMQVAKDLYVKIFTLRKVLETEIYRNLGKININSADQVSRVLFKELGYSTSGIEYKPKSNRYSVDANAMEILAKRYPVCEAIMAYRTCEKMISTYLEPLTRGVSENFDNRIHSSFWLTSKTGRTRSSNPNVQNVPTSLGKNIIHNKTLKEKMDDIVIRSGFTAPKGRKLVVSDFSQIELRVGAIVSGEPELLEAYLNWSCPCGASGSSTKLIKACPSCGKNEDEKGWKVGNGFWHGKDLHSDVLLHVPEKTRQRLTRQHGKGLNFLVLFYGGAYRLNQEFPELSAKDCEEIVESIMKGRKRLGQWHQDTIMQLKKTRKVRDFFGRVRTIPRQEIEKSFKHCANQVINTQVQGPACILTQIVMNKLRPRLRDEFTDAFLVNMVHDEIAAECNERDAEKVAELVTECMESVEIGVPIRAETKIVSSWDKAK